MKKISKLVKKVSVRKAVEKVPIGMAIGVMALAIFEIAKSLGYKEACNDLNESHEHLVKSCKDSIDSLSKEYENSLKLLDEEYERALEEENPACILQEFLAEFFRDITKDEIKEIAEVMKKLERSIL
jgi:hypothetical protein